MALIVADRVLETCTAPGIGAITLLGATTGYQTFYSGVGNTNSTYYTIADQNGTNWEVGIGTYTTSTNTLSRDTIYASSNAGSIVNFSSGMQNVFVTYPAEKAIFYDANGNIVFSGAITIGSGSINNAAIGAITPSTGAFSQVDLPSGTVNGVTYVNGSNVLASGSAMTFDGANFLVTAYKETQTAISASNIDLSTGNYFTKTISGTTTFTVSNVPSSGTTASFILNLTNGGSATVNWWSGVKWPYGIAPALTTSGRDVLGFFTYDGGTTWTGLMLGKAVS